ncbi:ABC transporter ATP-binding protein [Azospirillum agricola]|uniref:ABC transporter ATP-binding protein n=1 Tax=Azospirillum agricola TaxID=1720247 RepID=UPI000A0EF00B|nr:ABC transporter ATP-binding protein [Azospirillum agricola]SMH38441.1 amino acid/amide ABC transporter ATP-binding protein 1, HAAT family [Azospirillum lipoferum]
MTSTTATATPALSVRDLSVNFGGLQAVAGVGFEAGRGRITSVIGPNGAGKSTLFNLISGAIRPTGGRVTLDGTDVTGRSPDRMLAGGLARSFQITNLFFELPVLENLRIAAQILETPWRAMLPLGRSRKALVKADALLERFGLTAKADALAGNLSHGEQRRLEIAVALACEPRVLLLDEPTQGMSHGDTADTGDLIKSLAGDLTVLLIEHDIGLVMSLSDHVVVMAQGRKIAEGPPTAVRANPAVQAAYFGHA